MYSVAFSMSEPFRMTTHMGRLPYLHPAPGVPTRGRSGPTHRARYIPSVTARNTMESTMDMSDAFRNLNLFFCTRARL